MVSTNKCVIFISSAIQDSTHLSNSLIVSLYVLFSYPLLFKIVPIFVYYCFVPTTRTINVYLLGTYLFVQRYGCLKSCNVSPRIFIVYFGTEFLKVSFRVVWTLDVFVVDVVVSKVVEVE